MPLKIDKKIRSKQVTMMVADFQCDWWEFTLHSSSSINSNIYISFLDQMTTSIAHLYYVYRY